MFLAVLLVGFHMILSSSSPPSAYTVVSGNSSMLKVIEVPYGNRTVPCIFFNYGSYGGAALSCDWEVD